MSQSETTIGPKEGTPGQWACVGLTVPWMETRAGMIKQVRDMYERQKAQAEAFLALSDNDLVVHVRRGDKIVREVTE